MVGCKNIYFSNGEHSYILKENNTWEPITWNGLTYYARSNFRHFNIWTDGENTYYSGESYSGASEHYILKENNTWKPITWTGLTSFQARYVWSDGISIYVDVNDKLYKFNK